MSMHIRVVLECSECNAWFPETNTAGPPGKRVIRGLASQHGWRRVDGEDVCPDCYGRDFACADLCDNPPTS